MGKIARLLHHPERVFVEENCHGLIKEGKTFSNQEAPMRVVLPVDALVGNQDPYVFHNPWLYGYCRNANMPQEAGSQSVIFFGTFHERTERFLVDTVFVTEKRSSWLKDPNAQRMTPSPSFQHPITDRLYRDFLQPGMEDGAHYRGAKWIFEARHYQLGDTIMPTRRSDQLFSFIPLRLVDGVFCPVDVMPFLRTHAPAIFDDFRQHRNRLYKEIEGQEIALIQFLMDEATHLVTRTSAHGAPEQLNMDLQMQYAQAIYQQRDLATIRQWCFPDARHKHDER